METKAAKANLPAIIFLVSGLFLFALAKAGVIPAAALAKALSSDGLLSGALLLRLEAGQSILGLCLAACGLLGFLPDKVLACPRKRLARLPELWFLVCLFACSFGGALAIQFFAFQNMPHVTDATSHLFQARLLAEGQLFAPAPPCPWHFWQHNTVISATGKWYTLYPMGTALWYAWGYYLQILWAPGPLASGLATVGFYKLLCPFIRGPWAKNLSRTGAILFALSPMGLLLGGSFMSHTPFMMFALCGLAWMAASLRRATLPKLQLAGAGFLLGWTPMTRPPEAVLLVLACGLVFLAVSKAWKIRLLRASLFLVPGYLVPLIWNLYTNIIIYETPWVVGYGATDVGSYVPVIKMHFGFSADYPFERAVRNFAWVAPRANLALLGWPTSFLFLPFALAGRLRDRAVWTALAAMLAFAAFFFCYSYPGYEFEGRFYFLLLPLLVFLSLYGLQTIGRLLPSCHAEKTLFLLLTALTAFNLFYAWPKVLWPQYASGYEHASPEIARQAHEQVATPAVILVDSTGAFDFRYSSVFPFNDPWLKNKILFARDTGSFPSCLAEHFPERTIFRFVPGDKWDAGRFEKLDR